jgi:membrane protease YdiL (CAAX protease family)
MPFLQERGFRPDISWFVAGGTLMLAFLLMTGAALVREGTYLQWKCRLRLHQMSRRDWNFAATGLAAAACGSALLMLILSWAVPSFSPHPAFLEFQPLRPGERWVLLAWLPMFVLNIVGEEFFGRGYLLPRNEARFGKRGWVVNACGWLLFHAAFGPWVMILTAPIIFCVAWAVQKSGNTVAGLIIHGLANGPAFLLIALGYMSP